MDLAIWRHQLMDVDGFWIELRRCDWRGCDRCPKTNNYPLASLVGTLHRPRLPGFLPDKSCNLDLLLEILQQRQTQPFLSFSQA